MSVCVGASSTFWMCALLCVLVWTHMYMAFVCMYECQCTLYCTFVCDCLFVRSVWLNSYDRVILSPYSNSMSQLWLFGHLLCALWMQAPEFSSERHVTHSGGSKHTVSKYSVRNATCTNSAGCLRAMADASCLRGRGRKNKATSWMQGGTSTQEVVMDLPWNSYKPWFRLKLFYYVCDSDVITASPL